MRKQPDGLLCTRTLLLLLAHMGALGEAEGLLTPEQERLMM